MQWLSLLSHLSRDFSVLKVTFRFLFPLYEAKSGPNAGAARGEIAWKTLRWHDTLHYIMTISLDQVSWVVDSGRFSFVLTHRPFGFSYTMRYVEGKLLHTKNDLGVCGNT